MDTYEAADHCGKIERLWPKSAELTDDEIKEFKIGFSRYDKQIIKQAISKVKTESKIVARPGFGKFKKACDGLSRNRGSSNKGEECQWCHDRWLIKVFCFVADDIDIGQYAIPTNMRTQRPAGDWNVHPEVGEKLKLKKIELNLKCHHCNLKVFEKLPSVKYFHEKYGRYCKFEWTQDEDYFDRCLEEKAPPKQPVYESSVIE